MIDLQRILDEVASEYFPGIDGLSEGLYAAYALAVTERVVDTMYLPVEEALEERKAARRRRPRACWNKSLGIS